MGFSAGLDAFSFSGTRVAGVGRLGEDEGELESTAHCTCVRGVLGPFSGSAVLASLPLWVTRVPAVMCSFVPRLPDSVVARGSGGMRFVRHLSGGGSAILKTYFLRAIMALFRGGVLVPLVVGNLIAEPMGFDWQGDNPVNSVCPGAWWRSLLSWASANSFRYGPGLANLVRAAVIRWIAHEVIPWLADEVFPWIAEHFVSLLESVWSCIGVRLR